MKWISVVLLMACAIPTKAQNLNTFFDDADAFFKRYVMYGEVDYTSIYADATVLHKLIDVISNADLSEASDIERKAFYINAYNIEVINLVVSHYPLKSVMAVDGFFDAWEVKVAGEKMTLNELEKQKLLTVYHDPRLHFVLCCAAKGCPSLNDEAYKPTFLEQQLVQRTRLALNDEAWVRYNGKEVWISKIFLWYKGDFISSEFSSLVEFINHFRESKLPENTKVGYYEYNWSLNEFK